MANARNTLRWLMAPPSEEFFNGPLADLRRRIEAEAEGEGLAPLEPRQWAVIRFVLDYYWRHHRAPVAVRIGRATGLGVKSMHRLFPAGAAKTVFRLSGIEMPPELPHNKSLTWWH